ncbi:MAG: archease [DPANN group archaeon]|nr:archease [DPANN group archaeon]
MRFKFIPHTADVRFEAYGSTYSETFSNAVLAMFNIMTDTEKIKSVVDKYISVSSESLESLLYDFLEEFLVLFDSEGFVPHSVSAKIENSGDNYTLKAKVSGDTDLSKYEIKPDVKAVTYNEMSIKKIDGVWVAHVICDV